MEALHQPFPMLPERRAQVWRHQPAFRRPRHFHAEPELNLVLHGWATVGVGRQQFTLEAGDAAYFPPTIDHELVHASPDLELWVTALTPELAESADTLRLGVSTPVARKLFDSDDLEEEFRALGTLEDRSSLETKLAARFRRLVAAFPSASSPVRRTLERLEQDASLEARQLTRELRISPAELSRRVHREMGIPFHDLRTRRRLLTFVEAVDQGASYLAASAVAGFGSYAQLHRSFVGSLGCAPRAYFAGRRFEFEALVRP